MSEVKAAQHTLPNDQPVVALDASVAFHALTNQQQLYSHYLSRASFYGGLIVLVQTSPESPQIYRLLQRLIVSQKLSELKTAATEQGRLSEADFQAFLVYASGVFANMGNYKGFGDSKMIPNLSADQFEALVQASQAYEMDREGVQALWDSCSTAMYSLTERLAQLGLGAKGVTKYLSDNCSPADSDLINRYFKQAKIEGYMNRVIKTTTDDGKSQFEIRNAAVKDGVLRTEEFEGAVFKVTQGDYNQLLAHVNKNLAQAKVGRKIQAEAILPW